MSAAEILDWIARLDGVAAFFLAGALLLKADRRDPAAGVALMVTAFCAGAALVLTAWGAVVT